MIIPLIFWAVCCHAFSFCHSHSSYLIRNPHAGFYPFTVYLRGRVWFHLSSACCLGSRSLLLAGSPLFCHSLSRLDKCSSVNISSFVRCSSSLNVSQWTSHNELPFFSISQLHLEMVSNHSPIIQMAGTAFRGKSGRIYEHLTDMCIWTLKLKASNESFLSKTIMSALKHIANFISHMYSN